jgi:hypothetical protein
VDDEGWTVRILDMESRSGVASQLEALGHDGILAVVAFLELGQLADNDR